MQGSGRSVAADEAASGRDGGRKILVESLESRIVLSDPTVAINGIAITLNVPGRPRSRAP